MVVARVVDGHLQVVDRLKERVGLAAGLTEDKRITAEAEARALRVVGLFGQRTEHMAPNNVRAVGTNTLRMARNGREFLMKAEQALGHPIRIISGREEARLIYLGVAHAMEDGGGRRLVIDIGGGSTEFIIGERFEALQCDSLHMGCVTFSLRFFEGTRIRAKDFADAQLAAAREMQGMRKRFRSLGWQKAVGASGTVLAVDAILKANDWSKRGITARGLSRLRKAMVAAGDVTKLNLPGLQPERIHVLPGGVAILSAILEQLEIDALVPTSGALREGLIYDQVGRLEHRDIRDSAVQRMADRFHVDMGQALRVEDTAVTLLEQAFDDWQFRGQDTRQLLSWAARLHEIGQAVSYSGYHKHGAYLVANSEMSGFSREEKEVLAALILSHRRKIRPGRFVEILPKPTAARALRLSLILRLAVLLNRKRSRRAVPVLSLSATDEQLCLTVPDGFLAENPLTAADLAQEACAWREVGYTLSVSEAG